VYFWGDEAGAHGQIDLDEIWGSLEKEKETLIKKKIRSGPRKSKKQMLQGWI